MNFLSEQSVHRCEWGTTIPYLTLTGVAQWVGYRPANGKVAGLIPVWARAWVVGHAPGTGV